MADVVSGAEGAQDDEDALGARVASLRGAGQARAAWEACMTVIATGAGSSFPYRLAAEIAFNDLNDAQGAADILNQAVARFPDDAEAGWMAGLVAFQRLDLDAARRFGEQALATAAPRLALRIRQSVLGDYAGALALAEPLLAANPEDIDLLIQAGLCAHLSGDLASAEAFYERARRVDPDRGDIIYPLADVMMLQGRPGPAWTLLQSLTTPGLVASHEAHWPHLGRYWRGEPLAGRRILVLSRLGLGDALMYGRYAARLKAAGAFVAWAPPAPLARLFKGLTGLDAVVEDIGAPQDAPFDHWVHDLDLPARFGASDGRIEDPGSGYLTLPRDAQRPGLTLPDPDTDRLQVGLCWTTTPSHFSRDTRLLAPEDLAPLAALEGVDWHVLQQRPIPTDFTARSGLEPKDTSHEWRDLADTAAFVMNLDLVISICSAPVHLAGALGRPVWALIASPPEWRWGRQGETSPWYPATRIFRQPRPRDWRAVTRAVADAIRAQHGALKSGRRA